MIDYSEFVFFFLMLPVVIQIIFPLLILLGFGLVWAVRAVFGWQKIVDDAKNNVKFSKKNSVEKKLIYRWQTIV